MSAPTGLLTPAVQDAARRSVLCWLATADASGQPNVSPKEVWAVADDAHVVVANIASPQSARNIAHQPQVCLSFVDVFVQKGFKLVGTAREVRPDHAEFAHWAAPLALMAGPKFVIRSVWVIRVTSLAAIVAPSYLLDPTHTTEEAQIAAAMQSYGVRAQPAAHHDH